MPDQPRRRRQPGRGSPPRARAGGAQPRSDGASRRSDGTSRGGAGRAGGSVRGSRDSTRESAEDTKRKARKDLRGEAQNLPRWVVDDLTRVTPKERVAAALEALGDASAAMGDARYHAAVKHARKAKGLAPRDATVRETLGLAAYRVGDWQTALSELRTYRRFSGETTHLPVEIDALRALGKPRAVENAWEELQKRGGKPIVMKEGLVVYASFLIDQGDAETAYELTAPGRITARAYPQDLRVWYVAARAAAVTGRGDEAGRLRNAILENDPAFPGIDDLESMIRASGR